ncbi:unnamed protein product [Brassica rapa subsp. narinosa]
MVIQRMLPQRVCVSFLLSVYNLNILLEGLGKNLEYGKTVILLREVRLSSPAVLGTAQEYLIKPDYFVSHNLQTCYQKLQR